MNISALLSGLLCALFVLAVCVRCSVPNSFNPQVVKSSPKQTLPTSQTQPVSQTVVSSVLPQVVSATLTGVPTENIRVDSVNQTITISLPENYFVLKPTLSLVLSCTDCAIKSGPKETPTSKVLLLAAVWGGNGPFDFQLQRTGSNLFNTYKVAIRQDNPLVITPLAGPLRAELGGSDPMVIQVKNHLDGVFTQAIFTNKVTGKEILEYAPVCPQNDADCMWAAADKLYLYVGSILPGEYDILLKKRTGRQAAAPYSLLVSRGKLQFSGIYGPILLKEGKATVFGLNLYEDDKLKLLITNFRNYSAEVDLTNFTENTRQATVALPADLQPGNYWAQVKQRNGVLSESKRFGVITDLSQPYIFSMYDDTNIRIRFDQLPDKPIILLRERRYYAEVTLSPKEVKKNQIKLVDAADAQKITLIDMVIDDRHYSPTGGFPPSFIIPNTVSPGLYRVSFLVGIDANTVRETPPFEQVFEVK